MVTFASALTERATVSRSTTVSIFENGKASSPKFDSPIPTSAGPPQLRGLSCTASAGPPQDCPWTDTVTGWLQTRTRYVPTS